MKVVVSVGASGSGKSTYLQKNYPTYACICPDDIRKQLTGDVNNQSKNVLVWKVAYTALNTSCKNGVDVVVSATNLTWKGLKELLSYVENAECEILLFKDSENWQLCRDRVAEDIKNGVDRSNTVNVRVGDSYLIQAMSEKYKILKSGIVNKQFPIFDFPFSVHYYEIDSEGNKRELCENI